MLPVPLLLRVARRLHFLWSSRWEPIAEPARAWRVLETDLAELFRLRRQLQFAASRNLDHARSEVTQQLTESLTQLGRDLNRLCDEYDAPRPLRPPVLVDFVRDLRQLESEFAAVEVRSSDGVIRAVTEPITLGGVPLGSFAIDFHWNREKPFLGAKSFEIVALEPNPPSGHEDVTHPHVQDGALCPGDAAESLTEAVAAGRLADAFLIVHAVLGHYNRNSAYVRLSEWDGFLCGDCRRRVHDEERFTCEECNDGLCDECAVTCAACSAARCGNCTVPCDVCQNRHCRECLITSGQRAVCADCQPEPSPNHEEDEPTDDEPEPVEDPAAVARRS